MAKQQQKLSLSEQITKEILDPYNFLTEKSVLDYRAEDFQMNEYKSIEGEDEEFKKYVIKEYGDYDTFLRKQRIKKDIHVYDPTIDYLIDVSVVKPGAVYKTDHISPSEVIMENLTGVCTVWFVKVNGSTRKLTCTLQEVHIPDTEEDTRLNFFKPGKNGRIFVWEINEQKWKSFYMGNVFKFVRDDSQTLE